VSGGRFSQFLFDTGAELSVFPATALESLHIRRFKELDFRQADGSILARWIGSAMIYAAGTLTTDDVVWGSRARMEKVSDEHYRQ
jgi:hypothetical protein